MRFPNSRAFLASLALATLASCGGTSAPDQAAMAEEQAAKPKLGLFTTLPIYWGEGGDIASILDNDSEPDWVRTELETQFEIVPLDTLEAEALEGLDRVLLAQPRPLAPSENVAFDQYLAAGGAAFIVADPMLTRHTEYGIGDPRRPQDVVLLSPLFNRMGVRLFFDEDQDQEDRVLIASSHRVPIELGGRFELVETGDPSRSCMVWANGLVARCTPGRGEVFLIADAAFLDWEGEEAVPESRKEILWALLEPLVTRANMRGQN